MEFRLPSQEELRKLEDALENTEEQQKYWDEICEKHKSLPKDTLMVAGFLKGVYEYAKEHYPNSMVLRNASYEYAKRLERLGTYKMEDAEPKVRSDLLLTAANLYLEADEMIGCLSDLTIDRQLESCLGAIHYREEAGLHEEVEKLGLNERKKAILGSISGLGICVVSKDDCKEILKDAKKVVDGVFVASLTEKKELR